MLFGTWPIFDRTSVILAIGMRHAWIGNPLKEIFGCAQYDPAAILFSSLRGNFVRAPAFKDASTIQNALTSF